ncbi:ead/Ea22-like family protein [Citrobacter freundii]|uniref:ead/Ea22-like family protein n=1 Tax=Citrobacter freundii TaxID=546 RepID=UPI001F160E74|nr:ead/Ea22-like family protein [Citrobacter freundii]
MKQIAQENIIELAKLGHERAAELKASCGAVDMRSVARLISDLATQLEVQYVRAEESQREFRAADATIHNLELKLTDLAEQLANAESKCMDLAAELSAVDKIHNEAVFITDDHYEQCPPEVQKIIRSLAVLQISACNAFLAEVRASTIDNLVSIKTKQLADMHPDTHAFGANAMSIRSQINELQMFAAQLRKGAAQ